MTFNLLLGLLLLQIGLTVKVLSLNVTDAFGQRTLEKHQISWECLIFAHFDNTANLKLQALHFLKLFRASSSCCDRGQILSSVLLSPLMVLKCVLDHRDSHDKNKWECAKNSSIGRPNSRNDLDQYAKKKVRVRNFSELNKQILGHEVEAGVLSRRHAIIAEFTILLMLLEDLIYFKNAALLGLRVGVA